MDFYKKWNQGLVQNILVGFICFCCPGMFNALNGIGGGGQVDPTVASDGNVALYSTFTIFGIMGGPINNYLGPKLTIFLGSLTYVLYSCSLWAYNHIQSRAFVVASGALLGVGAGMLWSAQGALMMAYPTEKEKGKFIGIFWIIFNFGGMIGGLISLVLNFSNESKGVTDGTYIAFIAIMAMGSILSLFVLSPANVVKSDGSKVKVDKYASMKTELIGISKVFLQWKMMLLVPLFIYSNWFYTYQFNGYNTVLFSVRTRSLNNCCYWGSQMLGSYLLGKLLDSSKLSRKARAILGLSVTTVFILTIWGGALAVQTGYSRENPPETLLDFSMVSYIGPFFLYIFFGLSDALVQSWSYWIMGSLTNDTNMLSRYSGFYKGFQSAGGAISWRLDSMGVEYMVQLIINWSLYAVACVFGFVVSCFIEEPTTISQDEEKLENVDVLTTKD